MDELSRISDRITVLRDGRYVDTLDTADTDQREVISLMVGRELDGEQRPRPVPADARAGALGARALDAKRLLRDVSFDVHARRDPRLRRAHGRRTHRGGPGDRRRRPPRAAASIRCAAARCQIPNPADAARLGIGYLSEDRKQLRRPARAQRAREHRARLAAATTSARSASCSDRRIEATGREYVRKLRIKTPSTAQLVQNLSGGNQQKVVIAKWLAEGLRHPHLRRADARHRRRRQGRDLRAAATSSPTEGKAIIMISSELPEVLRMSHRIAVMAEGRLTAVLDNADATQENIMDYATRFSAEGTIAR